MGWLRHLYHRLPAIRELRQIASSLISLESNVQNQTLQQLNQYTHFTLLQQEKYREPGKLNRHEFQVFSQSGEDGILAEIFRRIGVSNRFFVEIAAGDGQENNTAYLLSQGWNGLWVEGSAVSAEAIRQCFRTPLADGRLKLADACVTAANIEHILREMKVPAEFDLLSLDIDRNTYWVWKALGSFRPRAVVIEYNATFPPDVDWKVDYAPGKVCNETIYFGASLKAFELLGQELGYALVGCGLSGVNAFFVRNDLAGGSFAKPFSAENHYEPPRYFLIRREAHPPCFHD
ncbi:MAG: hypothetical protein V2A66_01520 [Pseudomonadota bacterium]